MRRRVAKTATGKRLQARVRRITPKKNKGLTESQISYRKQKKKRDDYWAHEASLGRRRA